MENLKKCQGLLQESVRTQNKSTQQNQTYT